MYDRLIIGVTMQENGVAKKKYPAFEPFHEIHAGKLNYLNAGHSLHRWMILNLKTLILESSNKYKYNSP